MDIHTTTLKVREVEKVLLFPGRRIDAAADIIIYSVNVKMTAVDIISETTV
jgi:hypothetical protein